MRILAYLVILAAAGQANAQATLPLQLREAPAIATTLPVPATDVVFESTTADKRITGRFGFIWSDRLFGDLQLSAPMSDSGDPVTVATIDGLSAGTTAAASIAIVNWQPSVDLAAQDRACAAALIPQVQKRIADYKPPTFTCSITSLPPEMTAEFLSKDAAGRDQMCLSYRDKLAKEDKAALEKQLEALQQGHLAQAAGGKPVLCTRSVLQTAQERTDYDAASNYGVPLIAGIRLKFDDETFKYYDPTTFESKKRKGINVSAGAYVGIVLDGVGTFSGLVRYERSYKQGNKSNICLPGTVTGSLVCDDLAKGAPQASQQAVVAISYQRTILGRVGLVGRIGGDVVNNLFMFELPVYFIQQKDSSFTGGLVLSASRKVTNDSSPMMMPNDTGWATTAIVFLGGRFDALGANTTWH